MKRHLRDLYASDQAVRRAEDFVGRSPRILELLDCVQSSNCVQIVGPRRIGKSSLLIHLTRASTLITRNERLEHLLMAYVNLQALSDPQEDAYWGHLLWSIRARLLERGAGETLAQPDVPSLPPGRAPEILAWCEGAPHETGAHISYPEAYDRLQRLKGLGFQRMTILMDELEILGQIPTQRDLTQRLRALAGDRLWPVTFVTASRLPIANLTQDGTLSASPFYNIFSQTLRLGAFAAEELKDLISLPDRLDAQGRLEGWTPDLSLNVPEHRAFIQAVGGSHPFYSTVACRRILRLLTQREREGLSGPLGPRELKLIEADLADDLSGQIDDAIADRTPEERLVLRRVAVGQGDIPEGGERQRLLSDGMLTLDGGQLRIASRLVAAKVGPPPQEPKLIERYQRPLAVLALVGFAVGLLYLGNSLLGPLPRAPMDTPLALDRLPEDASPEDVRIGLVYPPEVRVEEETSVDVMLAAPPGPGGQVHVSLSLYEGTASFLDGEVQHTFALMPNRPESQLWSVRLIPRPTPERAYDLRLQATWSPESGATGQTQISDAIMITGRPLAGARVILTSAGTLLLGLLGFFGLNIHTALPWVWGLIKGREKADNTKDS